MFGIDPKKEIQMKVPGEEDQQTETANEIEGRKRKSPPTFEDETRKRIRTEAFSHQVDYNERMKNARPKAKTLNVGDYVSIKIDKVGKTPLHPNVLIGEILAFENNNNNNNNNLNIFMQDCCFSFKKKKTAINAGPV